MTGLATATGRLAVKAIAWVVFAVAGLLAAATFGWIPPELAAMLGSRHATRMSASAPDPAAVTPGHGPATGTSTVRRGTPRDSHTETDH